LGDFLKFEVATLKWQVNDPYERLNQIQLSHKLLSHFQISLFLLDLIIVFFGKCCGQLLIPLLKDIIHRVSKQKFINSIQDIVYFELFIF